MELRIDETLQHGIAAHKEGNFKEAELLYRAILHKQPKHPDANHNLGVLSLSLNKCETALPLFKTAIEVNSKIEQFWLSYIDALIRANQYQKARSVLVQGKKKGFSGDKFDVLSQKLNSVNNSLSPSQSQLKILLEHYQNGRYDETEKLAISITEQFPNHQFSWKILGAVLKQTGRISEGVVASQKAVEINPKDAEAHSNLGAVLQDLNRLEEAEASYKEGLSLNPNLAKVHYNLGSVLQKLGRLEEAETCYKQEINLEPSYAEAYNNLGNTLKELGRLKESEINYRQAILLKPKYREAHYNLGNILRDLLRLEESETSFRQAIALKPEYSEAHYNLGNILKELVQLKEAEASFRQAIAINPNFAEAYCNLGIILQELDRSEESEAIFRQAIVLKPDYAESYSNLGVTLKILNRLEEAEASERKAIVLKPDSAVAYSNLGVTLQALGRSEESEVSYRKAIALQADYAVAHNNMGLTQQELGRFEDAEASYRKAITLNPKYTDAFYNLGLLLYESKQYEKAIEQFKLSKLEKSKSYLLRCLYLQDKEILFFDQLDYFINLGEINPMIGSLVCRSALRYGVEKPNLFCKDPLKYFLQTNLNNKYDFEKIFVKTTRTILNGKMISNRKQGLLTNGYQTYGNLFHLETDLTEKIQKIIRLEIEKYKDYFKESGEGFITSWPDNYILNGWIVSMKSGGELQPHMHEDGWLSGSVYINVPSDLKSDSGNLVVCIEEKYLAVEKENQEKSIDVITGSLCLFPASLLHYTIPFESEEERIVLAFDVVPKY